MHPPNRSRSSPCSPHWGLVGLSANPILVSLAVRFGGEAPTLAAAMPTSIFNAGTALGTAITTGALETGVGVHAPAIVGTVFALLVFVSLLTLALIERRRARSTDRSS